MVFVGFFRFMRFLEFDEIPLDAGQYFASSGMHDHIVFDSDAPNAFYVHPRLYGNHISRFKSNRLFPRDPGSLVHFQSDTMTGAMHEI